MPDVPNNRTQIREAIIKAHAMVARDSWGATTPKFDKLVLDWNYTGVAVHHSGNWGIKAPTGIEKKHMVDNNYDDVGYHYLIHPSGTIYEGRGIVYKGSHVRLTNTGNIGILMMGDYDYQFWDDDDDLTNKHLTVLKELVATLKRYFPLKYFGGHKEFMKSPDYSCPGSALMAVMAQLRTDVSLNAPP